MARSSEPMFGQMRIAWWREELGRCANSAGTADPAARAIAEGWGRNAPDLGPLLDGWEAAITEQPDWLHSLADGRAAAGSALARVVGEPAAAADAETAMRAWHWGSISASEDDAVRAIALSQADALGRAKVMLPRALRPIAVLGGLGLRALRRGGGPLLGDRLSPLAALRIAIVGR